MQIWYWYLIDSSLVKITLNHASKLGFKQQHLYLHPWFTENNYFFILIGVRTCHGDLQSVAKHIYPREEKIDCMPTMDETLLMLKVKKKSFQPIPLFWYTSMGYFPNSNFASLGDATCYKPWYQWNKALHWVARFFFCFRKRTD